MSARRLTVWWDGRIAGCLAQDQHGDLSFAYYADWLDRADARLLPHSLPLQPEIFDRRAFGPFSADCCPKRTSAAAWQAR